MIKVIYRGDTEFFDGLTRGKAYDVIGQVKTEYSNQYVVNNDLGATSTISVEKFIIVQADFVPDYEALLDKAHEKCIAKSDANQKIYDDMSLEELLEHPVKAYGAKGFAEGIRFAWSVINRTIETGKKKSQ